MLTVIVTAYINRNKNSLENNEIKNKVEDYRKEVNGNVTKQLQSERELGRMEGRSEKMVN